MKAIMIHPAHEFTWTEKEKPEASGNWVVLKSKYAAICGSDKGTWKSADGKVLGHEFSGYIEDPGRFPFKKGQRVLAPEFNPCGECEFCRAGQEQRCLQMIKENPGVTVDGAFGEYYRVRGEYVIPVPDDMPLLLGSIVEPVSISLHGVRLAGVKPGDSVLIWGNGPIGVYAAAAARLSGAAGVYVVGRGKGRVERCAKYSFVDKCFSTLDEDYKEQLQEVMPEGGFAAALDCTGIENYDEIAGMLKPGASIITVGMGSKKISYDPFSMFFKEIGIRASMYYNWQEFQDAFAMVRDNQNMFMETVTSVIPADPEKIQEMFIKLFESGANDECKAIVEFED